MYTRLPVIIDYELRQKAEEGYDVETIRQLFDDWLCKKGCKSQEVFYALRNGELCYTEDDVQELENLYTRLMSIGSDQRETDSLEAILTLTEVGSCEEFSKPQTVLDDKVLYDKIYGGWLGRSAGCTLGKPVELWPHEKIISYLKLAGAFPLNDYIPEMDPMPQGYVFKDESDGSTKGNIDGVPRDDDMDYPILNLMVLEEQGAHFTSKQIGEAWLSHIPYHKVYTAERVAYRNLINCLSPPQTARHRNPYREWIGAQIRADLWGWVNPGRPLQAVQMAYKDATLSHDQNGVYGALWVSAMLAIAFHEQEIEAVVEKSRKWIPRHSRLYDVIANVQKWHQQYDRWEDCFTQIRRRYGHYHKVHVLNNAAVVCMALLYSGGNFEKGITTAVMAGWDTDCNGATVGSVLGVLNGAKNLPKKWIYPLQNQITSYVLTDRETSLSSLALRTMIQAKSLLRWEGNG